jgi:hypothetical protein
MPGPSCVRRAPALAGGDFIPDPDDFVASLLGKGAQVPLIAGTGFVGG